MDEAREYLMQSGSKGGGPIAGALNWLSNAAFGAGRAGAHVGSFYRQWLSLNADREHRRYVITACNTIKHQHCHLADVPGKLFGWVRSPKQHSDDTAQHPSLIFSLFLGSSK
jgi:hypothetical protein